MHNLIQERDTQREREVGERGRRPSAAATAEEELWCAIAPMAARKSGSARRGSGGGDGRRGYQYPFGPVPALAGDGSGGVERRGGAGEALHRPWTFRDRIGMWEGFVAATNLG